VIWVRELFALHKYLALKIGALLSLIFLLVAVFGWDLLQDMEHLQYEAAIVERSNHQSHDLHAIEMGVYSTIKVANDFLITGDHRAKDLFQQHCQHLVGLIETYQDKYADESLSALRENVLRIQDIANAIFNLPFATENMEGPIFVSEIAKEVKQVVNHVTEKHHALDAQVNSAMQMMEGLRLDMKHETLALLVVLLVGLGFLAYFIFGQIVQPLVNMKHSVQRVGEGDFDVACSVTSQDEIGELAGAFNAMGGALQEREQKLNRVRSMAAHQEKMNTMGVMTASIAHEVGNPLASMTMLLQLALRKLKKNEHTLVEQHLQSAVSETERMESIIQTVLSFGRHEADASFHDFDVTTVIEEAVRMAQMSPQHKRVPIQTLYETDIPAVYASSSMLMQVLMNLIYNACHACAEAGEISIHICQKDQQVVVEVCDTGHGIADELSHTIFEPSVSTKDKSEGSGFGLAISKELMDAMHGTLELRKDNQNKTCFRISLPQAIVMEEA